MRCLDELATRFRTPLGAARWASLIQQVRLTFRSAGAELEPRQRLTLELGSWAVLGMVGLGLGLDHWSVSSVLLAIGGYLTWVIVYSEVTVQASSRRSGIEP